MNKDSYTIYGGTWLNKMEEVEESDTPRVVRGGAGYRDAAFARAVYRGNLRPVDRGSVAGFRVVEEVKE